MSTNAHPQPPPPPQKMVAWYDPVQLCKTAIDVFISLVFGRHADYRLIEALSTSNSQNFYDYTHIEAQKEFWIDYVADLGDGWNSTYTVAYYISQPSLTVHDEDGSNYVTERGSVLIFGGDSVYPVAGRSQYKNRLVTPYATALRETTEPHPDLYVIPGNHDWYDSLVNFTRLFCAKRWFAGWRTQQDRSYFAIKLPYHWWIIGADIQLSSEIDDMQIKFLKWVALQMDEQDKVIICAAEPEWIYAKSYGALDPEYNENNLAFLETVLFKNKVQIFLTGDLHHYRRHENPDKVQKIIAGGGGAFLHPTHGQDVSVLPGNFNLKKSFPEPAISRKLCWRNLAFLFLNPYFGIITGLFYVLTNWSVKTDLSTYGLSDFGTVMSKVINEALKTPMGLFWIVAVILGFIVFTDTHSRYYRIIAGTLHSISHLFAAFLLGWAAIVFCAYLGLPYDSTLQLLLTGVLIFIGGWIIGSSIMGIYLFLSLNGFGRHSNEAFSSLAIQDWKNFLRIKIEPTGEVTIYPIGMRKVPRKWKAKESNTAGPDLVPDDSKATAPELIEKPIKLSGISRRSS
ncbi:TPA: metallophosphoesterase [Legionella anisa]